jgi:hypothetical protein
MEDKLDFDDIFEPELDFLDAEIQAHPADAQESESSSRAHAPKPVIDTRPPEERIASLLDSMKGQRKIFLETLAFCDEPKTIDEVNGFIAKLQEASPSVYSPANLCSFLEQAGALRRQDAQGVPASELDASPDVVVEDGVEYLRPSSAPQTFWVRTDAGAAALADDDPAARLTALVADESTYLPIYTKILELCSAEGGASIAALGEAVDDDPLLQEPRYYVQRFVNKLEECDAIAWQDAWHTTETGAEFLAAQQN